MLVTILSNRGSRSAANLNASLRNALPDVRIGRASPDSSRRCNTRRVVLNLGVGTAPVEFRQRELIYSNTPEAVRNCSDKIRTLLRLGWEHSDIGMALPVRFRGMEIPHVEWAHLPQERRVVEEWLETDGKIVARMTTTGHSGAGIQIIRRGSPIPDAPLYTRYFRKDAEYRVHVAFGNAILIQQKRRRDGAQQEGEQALIRTHANGWVFTVNDLSCDVRGYTEELTGLALRAAAAVGAGHCAVDILVRHGDVNNMVVCEINSCPALEANTTLNAYTQAFADYIRGL